MHGSSFPQFLDVCASVWNGKMPIPNTPTRPVNAISDHRL